MRLADLAGYVAPLLGVRALAHQLRRGRVVPEAAWGRPGWSQGQRILMADGAQSGVLTAWDRATIDIGRPAGTTIHWVNVGHGQRRHLVRTIAAQSDATTITVVLCKHQRSPALNLVFEGRGSPCVYDYLGGSHVLVRLHVENLRTRPLREVRVRLTRIHVPGTPGAAHEADWLKWMHGDGPDRPASVSKGKELRPGSTPDAYIDVVSKRYAVPALQIEFAMEHLRNMPIPAQS